MVQASSIPSPWRLTRNMAALPGDGAGADWDDNDRLG
jgi:hypothetical protein